MEGLTDEERKALRGSKFAHLPPSASSPSRSKPKPRLPQTGGPLTTDKAAALAKFLERKLQEPNGLASIKPVLVELAIKNAKDTVNASGLTGPVFTPRLSIYWDVVVFVGGVLDLFPSYHLSSKDTTDAVVKRPKKKLKL
ncbi:hypothetical protein ACSBR1_005797 [Camellia fascicularis]